jgi:hypothetical protein
MKYIIKQDLKDSIRNNKVVFFIGSGFSSCFKFPNWQQMVIDVIRKLMADNAKLECLISPIENGIITPIEALEKLKDHKEVIYDYIQENFIIDEGRKNLLNDHKKIWDITNKVITTNYDQALEEANSNVKKIVYNYDYEIAKLRNDDSYLLKLHGSIENMSSCIIFNEDYKKLYDETDKKCAIFQLQKIISENTVVFIGFSLNDPYVCEIFKAMNKIYNGHVNKHYIISTSEDDFSEYRTEIIKLDNWSQLSPLLDKFASYKNTETELINEIGCDMIEKNLSNATAVNFVPKVAILMADPIDKNSEINKNEINQYFSKIEMIADFYFLSIDTLRELEDYDYIIMFCKTVKNKLYIENEFLVSLPITIDELFNNINTNNIKCIYLFTNSYIDVDDLEDKTPIVVVTDDKKIKDSVFHILRRADKKFIESKCQLINITQNELKLFNNGKSIFNSSKVNMPDQIDIKNLKGFVGRCNDLEDIIRKILQLKINGQILNIKGAGGLGKTTITKKATWELSKRGYFKDGIYFIDCEHIDNCKLLESKISYCFELDNSINLREHIKQNKLNKDSLIILDNFETLVYLKDIENIKDLVSFISDYASIVITSREIVFSEKYVENVHDLRAFSTDEAIELFIQNYPYVKLEEQNILRKEIIEELLNNNPLAIKIITNNLPKGKSITFLKDELEKDFFKTISEDNREIYNNDSDENIEKSKSLYQSINYSYKKLQEKEKLAFELLSLFPDGINIENFKNFFEAGIKKYRPSVIADKDLKILENKSLVEINSQDVRLQSIIKRFAMSRFKCRSIIEKKAFYKEAYEYNKFIISLCNRIQKKNTQRSYKFFDLVSNNVLESIYYLNELDISDEEKVLYLDDISEYFTTIGRGEKFINKLELEVTDISNSDLKMLLTTMKLLEKYFDSDFDYAFKKIQSVISFEELDKLDPTNRVHTAIVSNVMAIFDNEGYLKESLYYVNKFGNKSDISKNSIFYRLGEFSKISGNDYQKDFFDFEIDLILNQLNIEELDEYIRETHSNNYIELMQCNFIKAKLGLLRKKDIDKLVITNPYTKGIKYLMYALLEEDTAKASELYELAIDNLQHIKYYYVEAIYLFSKFLKNTDSIMYKKWFNLGYDIAKRYDFKYMVHLFQCVDTGIDTKYLEEKTKITDCMYILND